MFSLPQRPQSMGETIGNIFRVYYTVFSKMWYLVFILMPAGVIANLPVPDRSSGLMLLYNFLLIVAVVIFLMLGVLIVAMIINTIDNLVTGEVKTLARSLSAMKKKIPILLGSCSFFLMFCASGFIVAVIPYGIIKVVLQFCPSLRLIPDIVFASMQAFAPIIIVYVYSLLFIPVIVFGTTSGSFDTMMQSFELVRGKWWRTSIIVTLIFLLSYIVAFGASYVLLDSLIILGFRSGTMLTVLLSFETTCFLFLLLTLNAAAQYVLYHDYQLRKQIEVANKASNPVTEN